MHKTVAIQGQRASFHDIAAKKFFGSNYKPIFCDSFSNTVRSLKDKSVDYALCAIENSLYGSVNKVYDLILETNCSIFGEVYLRIEQCLIGLPDTNLEIITSVYSHPVAIAQCKEFLDLHLPNADRHEYRDTAASVEMLLRLNDPSVAAIASKEAAELYGAQILASLIETNKQNYTRFIALSISNLKPIAAPNKSSLVIEVSHKPGALHQVLGAFARHSINLTKLQSRPIIGKAWHYIFYIDVDAGADSRSYEEALAELATMGCKVKALGSYINGQDNQLS